jgi:hypothetical protein
MQFADIKNDIAFRKIFGNEQKTAPLISFLNAALQLEGNDPIKRGKLISKLEYGRVLTTIAKSMHKDTIQIKGIN